MSDEESLHNSEVQLTRVSSFRPRSSIVLSIVRFASLNNFICFDMYESENYLVICLARTVFGIGREGVFLELIVSRSMHQYIVVPELSLSSKIQPSK